LEEQRQQFQGDQVATAGFLAQLGLTSAEMASTKISLFCYPHAPVQALFDLWRNGEREITCLVPEGIAAEAVETFLGEEARLGAVRRDGALTVRVLPFVPQPEYDKLLWACHLNFVRGEDSFVRAQWAGRPFVWHIYPQDENLHHKKLRAFLNCYATGLESLAAFSFAWNGVEVSGQEEWPGWPALWSKFQATMPQIAIRATEWRQRMLANGDLATNLLKFAERLRSMTAENNV
jgi:uncharacterized repeat protein (TIGR03837 family)